MSLKKLIRIVDQAEELYESSISIYESSDDQKKLAAVGNAIRELSYHDEDEALRCLIRRARKDRSVDFGVDYAVWVSKLAAVHLAKMATLQTLPSLMLEIHHAPNPIRQGDFIRSLGKAGGASTLDILQQTDDLGQNKTAICESLLYLDAPAGDDILKSALKYPVTQARIAAGRALALRSGEADIADKADARVARWTTANHGKAPRFQSIELLTHHSVEVRRGAVRKWCSKPKESHILALALAQELDAVLGGRWQSMTPETPFNWGGWQGLIPRDLITGKNRRLTEWASELPKQKMTDDLRQLLKQGVEDFAASFPVDMIRLTDEEIQFWDEAERALIK